MKTPASKTWSLSPQSDGRLYSYPEGHAPQGFVPEPGFAVSGVFADGRPLTVTRSSGAWAARPYGNPSWLFDKVTEAWLGGVHTTPFAGYTDGQAIPGGDGAVPNAVWLNFDQLSYYTSRGRSSTQTATYSRVGTPAEDVSKANLGLVKWPAGFPAQNEKTIYLSWWQRVYKAYDPDPPNNSIKQLRLDDAQATGQGVGPIIANQGLSANMGAEPRVGAVQYYQAGRPNSTEWHRHELWVDVPNFLLYYWYGNHYCLTGNAGYGTQEIAKEPDWLGWALNWTTDTWLNMPTYSGITAYRLGWDAGSSNDPNCIGQQVDLQEVYIDTELERFEFSDSAVWNINSSATAHREIQGNWSRDSSTVCTVYVNQGSFTSMIGKYLWYVTGRATAELIGRVS